MYRNYDELSRRNTDAWKRTTNGPQTGDQVRSPAEEDGKEPDRIETQQEKKVKSPPESSDENGPALDDDKYEMAFKELTRILEAAALAGVESIGLEWQGDDLLVFHDTGSKGCVATKIAKPLQLELIAEIVSRAQIGRRHKGNMRLPLLGQDYSVAVEEYDRFGESAYKLTLKKRAKKRAE